MNILKPIVKATTTLLAIYGAYKLTEPMTRDIRERVREEVADRVLPVVKKRFQKRIEAGVEYMLWGTTSSERKYPPKPTTDYTRNRTTYTSIHATSVRDHMDDRMENLRFFSKEGALSTRGDIDDMMIEHGKVAIADIMKHVGNTSDDYKETLWGWDDRDPAPAAWTVYKGDDGCWCLDYPPVRRLS